MLTSILIILLFQDNLPTTKSLQQDQRDWLLNALEKNDLTEEQFFRASADTISSHYRVKLETFIWMRKDDDIIVSLQTKGITIPGVSVLRVAWFNIDGTLYDMVTVDTSSRRGLLDLLQEDGKIYLVVKPGIFWFRPGTLSLWMQRKENYFPIGLKLEETERLAEIVMNDQKIMFVF
ncbi:MAG: hypothetical protein CR997_13900 [Acidobacteria bacterium]|nr:MAG: hypothetical protein CR997_13900 [Acidobacteriota bacterium]